MFRYFNPLRNLNQSKQITRTLTQKHNITRTVKYLSYFVGSLSTIAVLYQAKVKYFNSPKPLPLNISNESLRSQFNFIDKVVKKCADSVVYVEIKDVRRFDAATGQPQITSNGSGFLVGEDGWILTNAHVVINKPKNMIMVMLRDGSTYEANVVNADMNIDLALLKIQANRKFPYLQLGNSSDVTAGEWVVALGSPLSLSHSVTAGIISSVDRGAAELGLKNFSMRYIQTDATITFGNSGGPLVNLDGHVIGINNLRVTAGIAFAIPIDYAKKFLQSSRLMLQPQSASNNRKQQKQVLGLTTLLVTPQLIKLLNNIHQSIPEGVSHGVLVWKVLKGTPAHIGGLQPGDIITHINGLPVLEVFDMYRYVDEDTESLKLNVVRGGNLKEIILDIL